MLTLLAIGEEVDDLHTIVKPLSFTLDGRLMIVPEVELHEVGTIVRDLLPINPRADSPGRNARRKVAQRVQHNRPAKFPACLVGKLVKPLVLLLNGMLVKDAPAFHDERGVLLLCKEVWPVRVVSDLGVDLYFPPIRAEVIVDEQLKTRREVSMVELRTQSPEILSQPSLESHSGLCAVAGPNQRSSPSDASAWAIIAADSVPCVYVMCEAPQRTDWPLTTPVNVCDLVPVSH